MCHGQSDGPRPHDRGRQPLAVDLPGHRRSRLGRHARTFVPGGENSGHNTVACALARAVTFVTVQPLVTHVQSLRRALLCEHRDTVAAVVDAGTAVAEHVGGWPVTDPERVRQPLRTQLRRRDLLEPLVGLLGTGADALGAEVQGTPAPAPPYLAVTSRGPLCRATLDSGRRLVVECSLFAVERRPRRYRYRDPTVEGCLQVSCR